MKKPKIYVGVLIVVVIGLFAINSCREGPVIPGDIPPKEVVTVYQDCDSGGYAVSLEVGKYSMEQLMEKGVENNDVSSVKVHSGYKVTFYSEDNFEGDSLTKIGYVSCLVADGWNDKATSLKIEANNGNNPPAAPTDLVATALSGTRVKLTWTDNSNNELIFNIEMSTDGRHLVSTFTVDQDFTSKEIYGLSVNKRYFFKVTAESLGGVSSPSNKVEVRTLNETSENIDDLMVYATGFTESSSTPMGKHYQGLHVTTAEDIAYLNNADNQPPLPPGLESRHLADFAVTLYPFGEPSPADINQHAIGDCNGITAMASMAYLAPEFVKSLIMDNGDATFTVAMFDPQGKPITVKVDSKFIANDNGDLDAVSGKKGVADWATVLEKAIMKYNVIYKANPNIGGIGSEHVTPLFTGVGNSFSFNRGVLTGEQLARVVRVSLAQGKFISGGFYPAHEIGNVNTVTGHGYAVMISADTAALFTMRNPWGVNPLISGGYDGSTDGVLNIPATGDVTTTIDFRIIDPGIAGTAGRTDAYIPPTGALKNVGTIRIPEDLHK